MKDDNDTSDEVVLVPVPKRHLEVVYRTLADAMSQDITSTTSPHPLLSTADSVPDPSAKWTKDEISQLKKIVRTSTARALLDLTTERRGEWVALSEIVEKAGRSSDAVRARMASLS